MANVNSSLEIGEQLLIELEELKASLENNPEELNIKLDIANIYIKLGNYDEAIANI